MTLDQLNELEDEFYGPEDDEEENGVYEDNYALADWSRDVVPELFSSLRKLLEAKE